MLFIKDQSPKIRIKSWIFNRLIKIDSNELDKIDNYQFKENERKIRFFNELLESIKYFEKKSKNFRNFKKFV